MKLEIKEKNNNKLLERTEIEAILDYKDTTPSREEVKKAIAKKENSEEDLIVVNHIYTDFGTTQGKVLAYIYKNKKALDRASIKKKESEPEKKETKEKEGNSEETKEEPKKKEKKSEKKAEESEKEKKQKEDKKKEKKEKPKKDDKKETKEDKK